MKLFNLVFFLVLLGGCAQLMRGEMQPVVIKDAKQQIYFTSCSGSVEEWVSCHQKAKKICVNGYDVLDRIEGSVGGKRELTFQCK